MNRMGKGLRFSESVEGGVLLQSVTTRVWAYVHEGRFAMVGFITSLAPILFGASLPEPVLPNSIRISSYLTLTMGRSAV